MTEQNFPETVTLEDIVQMYDTPVKSKPISPARQKMIESVQPLVDEYLGTVKALDDLGDKMFVPQCGKPGKGFKALRKVMKQGKAKELLGAQFTARNKLKEWVNDKAGVEFTPKTIETRRKLVESLVPDFKY
jgi:hypothetical protein